MAKGRRWVEAQRERKRGRGGVCEEVAMEPDECGSL